MMSTAGTYDGVFNFEGAVTLRPSISIRRRSRRFMAPSAAMRLLENVVVRADGSVDYADGSKTENTRVLPSAVAYRQYRQAGVPRGHPSKVIFLAADAFGVLPPVSRLTTEQMQYHFPVGFHLEAGGHRAWVLSPSRRRPSPLAMARRVPAVSPDPVRQRPGGEDGGIRAKAPAVGQHRLERRGQRLSLRDTRSIISAILNGTTGPLREEYHPGVRSCDPAVVHSKG